MAEAATNNRGSMTSESKSEVTSAFSTGGMENFVLLTHDRNSEWEVFSRMGTIDETNGRWKGKTWLPKWGNQDACLNQHCSPSKMEDGEVVGDCLAC